ncbi:MAG: hypothetical protein KDA33_07285 [Phycisphaerales bacterium]|nr:hypothetical protein [Phycisphaerales bacterium]
MQAGTESRRIFTVLALATFLPWGAAHGAYRLFDNFEDKTPGPVGGQDGWSAGAQNLVIEDPADPSNLTLFVPSTSSSVHKSLLTDDLSVANGSARMLFFRMRVAEKQTFSVGLSPLTNPVEYSDFAPEIGMANSAQNLDLRVWDDDGGMYENVTQLTANTWYNVWVWVDAASDTYQVWLHDRTGQDAKDGDKMSAPDGDETFDFRSGTSTNLISFYIRTSGGGSGTNFGPVYFDDIHLEVTDALNLSLPGTVAAGDIDADGDVDLVDRDLFSAVLAGIDLDISRTTRSDINGDGLVDGRDVDAFVQALLSA